MMTSVMTDEKRRFTMPKACPPKSALTIQQVDENTWILKRAVPNETLVVLNIPYLEKLPADPAWEKTESKIGRNIARRLRQPKD